MIGVYRIYLGRGWATAEGASALARLFDRLPEFLYSVATLDPAAEKSLSPEQRRADTMVAMTHAHVALLSAALPDAGAPWTRDELTVARTGFRWRIPVLGVVPPGGTAAGSVAEEADRLVGWSGFDIASAIQELAETAHAVRRSEIQRLASRDLAPPIVAETAPTPSSTERTLPMGEIVEAFQRLQAARNGTILPKPGSM